MWMIGLFSKIIFGAKGVPLFVSVHTTWKLWVNTKLDHIFCLFYFWFCFIFISYMLILFFIIYLLLFICCFIFSSFVFILFLSFIYYHLFVVLFFISFMFILFLSFIYYLFICSLFWLFIILWKKSYALSWYQTHNLWLLSMWSDHWANKQYPTKNLSEPL